MPPGRPPSSGKKQKEPPKLQDQPREWIEDQIASIKKKGKRIPKKLKEELAAFRGELERRDKEALRELEEAAEALQAEENQRRDTLELVRHTRWKHKEDAERFKRDQANLIATLRREIENLERKHALDLEEAGEAARRLQEENDMLRERLRIAEDEAERGALSEEQLRDELANTQTEVERIKQDSESKNEQLTEVSDGIHQQLSYIQMENRVLRIERRNQEAEFASTLRDLQSEMLKRLESLTRVQEREKGERESGFSTLGLGPNPAKESKRGKWSPLNAYLHPESRKRLEAGGSKGGEGLDLMGSTGDSSEHAATSVPAIASGTGSQGPVSGSFASAARLQKKKLQRPSTASALSSVRDFGGSMSVTSFGSEDSRDSQWDDGGSTDIIQSRRHNRPSTAAVPKTSSIGGTRGPREHAAVVVHQEKQEVPENLVQYLSIELEGASTTADEKLALLQEFFGVFERKEEEYAGLLSQAQDKVRQLHDFFYQLTPMSSNLPAKMRAQLQSLTQQQLYLLIDVLACYEPVVRFLYSKFPPT